MILYFHNISENDWFILICNLVAYAAAFRLRRAFPTSLVLLIGLFGLSLAKGADHTLGVDPLDFYDTNEIPVFDVTDLFTWFLYPVAGYLFVYAYYRLRVSGLAVPAFVLLSSGLAVGFELLCVKFHVFKYKDWTPAYSFAVYVIAQTATIGFFELVKHWHLTLRRRERF